MGFAVNGGCHTTFAEITHASRAPVYPSRAGHGHPPPADRPDHLAVARRPPPGRPPQVHPGRRLAGSGVGRRVRPVPRYGLRRHPRRTDRAGRPGRPSARPPEAPPNPGAATPCGPPRPTPEAPQGGPSGARLPPHPVLRSPGPHTTRAKSSAGTHTFHTYATACIVGGPGRYTLGRTAVTEKEPMTAVLARLLGQVAASRVPVRVVLLDRAFFSIAVMRLLQSRRLPFVIRPSSAGASPGAGRRPPGRGRSAGGARAGTSTPTPTAGSRSG